MRVFLTGASGHIGSAVVGELQAAGHQVVALARGDAGADALARRDVEVRRGDLDDLPGLRDAAADSDGVIHLAFKHDVMKAGGMVSAAADDLRAVEAMADGLAGTDKPLVTTSPIMLLAASDLLDPPYAERDALPGGPRIDTENATVAFAERGIRSAVVRLPPVVHSDDDGEFGFIPTLVRSARAAGASGYVADGSARWPTTHTGDVARLYRLALERAPAGSRLHAVAEDGVAVRRIAEAIGRGLDLPTDVVDPGDAMERFAFVGRFVALDAPTSSARTRELVGWSPSEIDLIADLDAGHYFRD